MKKKINITKTINRIADYFEMVIALILIVSIIFLVVDMILDITELPFFEEDFDFNQFLSKALNLIIGLEFTRMLCRHTPDTIIEVLMFATARQLIIAHSSVLDTLFGVISITILFLIRKFILSNSSDEEDGVFIKQLLSLKKNGKSKEKSGAKTSNEAVQKDDQG